MRTESLWFGRDVRGKDSCDIKLLGPRRRCWWWDQSRTVQLEGEAISWLARSLIGVTFDRYDLGGFEFTATDWDPTVSLWYMAPRAVQWPPELKRPSCLLELQIVLTKLNKSGPDETLASLTLFTGVRRVKSPWPWSNSQYETVWMYASSEVPEWQKEYLADDGPRTIWGPLNLADPKLRKYLPHRILFKKP